MDRRNQSNQHHSNHKGKKDESAQLAIDKVKRWLVRQDGVVVAFSGGVDSSLLLSIAQEVLGQKALAVTIRSPTATKMEVKRARRTAREIGARQIEMTLNELADERFVKNSQLRCYYCKKKRFKLLLRVAHEKKWRTVVEGSNKDDKKDFRPGLLAARELGVQSPFVTAGLSKIQIRRLSYARGLSVWNLPSTPCLATRIPYGQKITMERLARIERAEQILHDLGFHQVRVRDHDGLARIEVEPKELDLFLRRELGTIVNKKFKRLGFLYVAVDLLGFRSGSLTSMLKQTVV